MDQLVEPVFKVIKVLKDHRVELVLLVSEVLAE